MTVTPEAFSGLVSYMKNLLENLTKIDYQNRYFILINSKNKKRVQSAINPSNNFKYFICNFTATFLYLRGLWEQIFLPFFLKKKEIDVLYCPANIIPIFSLSKTIVVIATIGPFCKDIYANKNLSIYQKLKFRFNRLMMILSAKRANIVIFESDYVRKLFVKLFKVDGNKTKVIHHGKSEVIKPVADDWQIEKFRKRFEIEGKYILYVSHLHRYKNVMRLIQAFKKIEEEISKDIKLAIVGKIVDKEYYNEIKASIKNYNLENRILFIGEVPHNELSYLYSGCLFLVFPSLCENHSYTLVEALSCGTPIVCSNVTAMPETCGDAALYFNPYDVNDIAMKMLKMIKNTELRQKLSQKAIKKAETFPSYDEIACRTLEVFKEALEK